MVLDNKQEANDYTGGSGFEIGMSPVFLYRSGVP